MSLNIDEIIQNYSYSGNLDTHFPIEKFSCNISIRIERLIDDIDEVICGVIHSQGGNTDFNTLADILGLSVYDKPEERKYKDQAEIDILNHLLKEREDFYLLKMEVGSNPILELTELGLESITTKIKYQYFNTRFTGYTVNKFKGIPYTEVIDTFGVSPDFGDLRKVKNDEINSVCYFDKELHDLIQNQCAGIHQYQNVKLLSFKEPDLYSNFSQPIIYKLYQNLFTNDEVVIAYGKEKLLYEISTTINEDKNRKERDIIVREIKFQAIWNNPDTIYNAELLKSFLDKWDWIELLDKQIEWSDDNVWEIFNHYASVAVWNKITLIAPFGEIVNQLTKRIDRWNWTSLSERLPDNIILSNIDNPFLHWDFDVLSLKDSRFVRTLMDKIKAYNHQSKDQKIQPFWNFYDITETLEDSFIIEALAVNAAINFHKLSDKPYPFISQILKSEGTQYRNWNYDFFSENWAIDEVINEAENIGQYINWHSVLLRISSDEQLISLYLKSSKLNGLLNKYRNNIQSFTTEKIIWDEWLINYFDGYSLILWQTNRSHKGFDTNEYVGWNERLFQKYINNFSTPDGRTFLSAKINSVEFIRKNIDFEFDWVAIFDNLENNETLRKELSGNILFELRDKLPWEKLSAKIQKDDFILNNALRFKDYFDFKILSGRSNTLVQKLLKIPELNEQTWDWKLVTDSVSENFILENFYDYAWDFSVLSSKESSFVECAILSNSSYTLLWQWTELVPKLSNDFIIKTLPILNEKYGLLQPAQIQRFWNNITYKLDRDFLKSTAGEFLFEWDWSFITKDLFTKDEILNNLDDDAGYWDWHYLLNKVITTEELETEPIYRDIQRAKTLIKNEQRKKDVISLLTRKFLNKPALLEHWMNAEKEDTSGVIELDWDVLSNHKQFIYDDFFISKFVDYWNWDLLSENRNIFRLKDENDKINYNLVDSVKGRLRTKQFKWNWSVLSRNRELVRNFKILSDQSFIRKWDWAYISEFSEFINVNKKFNEIRYLYNTLQDFIDWKLLSRRKDIHFDKDLLSALSNKSWDWQFLSESNNLEIDNDLLIQLQANPWNWKALSKNKNIRLTLPKTPEELENNPGILISLKDKEWDWIYLSERKDLEVSYHLIKETKDKNWNYKQLTHYFLKDDLLLVNYLRLLQDKDLHWSLLSSSSKPKFTCDFINEFKNYWDWNALSNNKSVALTRELITQFDKWNFSSLTKRPEIIENPEWIFEQKGRNWDWNYISSNDKFLIDREFVDMFSDKLNFTKLSSNPTVKFTAALLKKYYRKWDYNLLEHNYSILRNSELTESLNEIISDHASIKFVQKIDSQNSKWKGHIYHFTHLTNAATVINSRKILSRNEALKNGFSNAAGSVVDNRHDAHQFARFYFRPQTPTQFYNENLGKDTSSGYLKQWRFYDGYKWVYNSLWKSHYPQALRLGLPRCPIPVFFRFRLNEVLEKMESICHISNGNMQTGWANYGSINTMIGKFNFEDLYSTINNTVSGDWHDYIEYSQQEFLVKDEFDFSDFESIEIIVPDESSKGALLKLVGFNNLLSDKILVDDSEFSIFHRENRKVSVTYDDNLLNVKTDYKDKHILLIEFDDSTEAKNIEGNIISVSSKIIKGDTQILATLPTDVSFKVKFIDELSREWIVFQNAKNEDDFQSISYTPPFITNENVLSEAKSEIQKLILLDAELDEIYKTKVRHYTLFDHTVLVYTQYLKYKWSLLPEKFKDLFKTFLLLHDVGKPIAFAKGNKDNQYKYTQEILRRVWRKTNFSVEELEIALALSSGDPIGEYFQGKIAAVETTTLLSELAIKANIDIQSFFNLFMIYYQCDISSYTGDAHGFKYLEHLFEYRDGEKIYDENEGGLRFSSAYHEKYLKLKQLIKECK